MTHRSLDITSGALEPCEARFTVEEGGLCLELTLARPSAVVLALQRLLPGLRGRHVRHLGFIDKLDLPFSPAQAVAFSNGD